MFLAVRKDADNNTVIFLEDDTTLITQNLTAELSIDYFFINVVGKAVALKPVTLKAGPRVAGQATEVAEIQADGNVIGSAEVPK